MPRYQLDVPMLTQRDNEYKPAYSCFPSSMGMATTYFMNKEGLSKSDIGCPEEQQIEDFLNYKLEDSVTSKWLQDYVKENGRAYSWLLSVTRREAYVIEAYIFNRFMKEHAYTAKYEVIDFAKYCDYIDAGFPVVMGGNFSPVSRISAHVVCGIGYDSSKGKIIVNDPYGSAYRGYPNNITIERATEDGTAIEYELKFFKNGKNINAVTFSLEI